MEVIGLILSFVGLGMLYSFPIWILTHLEQARRYEMPHLYGWLFLTGLLVLLGGLLLASVGLRKKYDDLTAAPARGTGKPPSA